MPICRELNTPAGPIDVLYATPQGKLVLLEAKLWRNPEARRKVVGQILDYAKELSRWDYEDLQREVSKCIGKPGNVLFQRVLRAHPDTEEAAFVDEVSRGLRQGRFLLLICGDGIREGVASIAEFLDPHGTLHFSLGLIEMALYRTAEGGLLVHPRVLGRSEIVKRTVITLEGEGLTASDDAGDAAMEEPRELSENERFYLSFWHEFRDKLRLDDVSQPPPEPRAGSYVWLVMPRDSGAWLNASLRLSSNEAAVWLILTKGALADRLYARLYEDREAIEAELGIPVEWESEAGGKYRIATKKRFPDLKAPEHREEIRCWLADRVNRFVNVFRPRLERLVGAGE